MRCLLVFGKVVDKRLGIADTVVNERRKAALEMRVVEVEPFDDEPGMGAVFGKDDRLS